MIFYTSDTHFNHANIIQYCGRPFKSLENMNKALIDEWNYTVGPYDTVYHLGDFAFGSVKDAEGILDALNGTIHLVAGNHDCKKLRKLSRWASVNDIFEVKDGHFTFVLCHYPMENWNNSLNFTRMLHGHEHGRLSATPRRLDVGVDCWDYRPVKASEILTRMDSFLPVIRDVCDLCDTSGRCTYMCEYWT